MSGTGENDARALAELRGRIDAIDAEIHRQLIARSSVIDALVRIKGTSAPGAAFRPAREADMMRRLVARHHGALPLATVEHIWREIITTFTRMQADFDVAFDTSIAPEEMRDLGRFYFGFSVDLIPLSGATTVVAHVAEANDLGLIAVRQPPGAGAWWRALVGPSAPRITALLPFIRAAGRPANQPAFVVSPRLADPTPPELHIYAAEATGFRPFAGCEVLASDGDDVLIAIPAMLDPAIAARRAGIPASALVEVGGIQRGIALDGAESLLFAGPQSAKVAS